MTSTFPSSSMPNASLRGFSEAAAEVPNHLCISEDTAAGVNFRVCARARVPEENQ